MTINDLKRALREVRNICARQKCCADCPLLTKSNGCPMRNSNDEATDYPENWSLDWGENTAQEGER